MSEIEEEEVPNFAQVKALIAQGQSAKPTSTLAIVALAAALGLAGGYIGAQFAGAKGEKGDTGAQGIQGPKGDPGELGIGAEFPKNAVLAFDDSAGCPEGWEPFRAAQSRAIIGATFGTGTEPGLGNNENGSLLIERKYRDHGGVEEVILTTGQMPRHKHKISTVAVNFGGGTPSVVAPSSRVAGHLDLGWYINGSESNIEEPNDGFIYEAGDNQPHNNMPPYIALYFCQKS